MPTVPRLNAPPGACNWPHPLASESALLEDALLLDLLLDWAPDERTRGRILADNPATLYDFGNALANEPAA